eukprot:m.97833 g.97833  ORF g.97833 m.97833 type:complete len:170 (+) comp8835_c0_seq1:249-758(+)
MDQRHRGELHTLFTLFTLALIASELPPRSPQATSGISPLPYPIIADEGRKLACKLGMLDPCEIDATGLPMTCRAVFIISPEKRVKLSMLYPATTGRNFDEIIRALDSIQMTEYKKVATPGNWKQGQDCMVLPSIKDNEIAKYFPRGIVIRNVPSGKRYLRLTADPSDPL